MICLLKHFAGMNKQFEHFHLLCEKRNQNIQYEKLLTSVTSEFLMIEKYYFDLG